MRLHCSVLLFIALLATSAQSQSSLRRIDSDAVAGLSSAVAVERCQLIHTTQILPVNADGRSAGSTTDEQLDRVLGRLDKIIMACKTSRDRVVKLNIYVADAAARDLVRKRLSDWFGHDSLPAVSYVETALPVAEAMVAIDAVIATDPQTDKELPSLGKTDGEGQQADWCVLPRGDVVYVSGQAEPGKLAEATRATLDSLLRTIRDRKLDRQHIVRLKCFLQPMSQVDIVDREIKKLFVDATIPPVSHVEWISGSRPIEIELIAHAPLADSAKTVSFTAPPWMGTSPVFSRVARIHGDRRIYISGLYSTAVGDGETQVKDIFRSLKEILAKTGSDVRHLAKATYYVSDDDASAQLNAIRPSIYDPKRPPAASKAMVKSVAAKRRSIAIDMIAAPFKIATPLQPLVRVVDLNVGESTELELCNGQHVQVKLLALEETRDPIRQAVRSALVTVQVDGDEITLESGMYNLPRRIGSVQIDCSVTKGYNSNGSPEFWGLDKDARLRLWPNDSPLLAPGSLIYPVEQRWFATRTWFDNEPVDGGTKVLPRIYYHSGLDIGGSEKQVKVIAATDAVVVSSGEDVLEEHRQGTPVAPRYDVVYLLDGRGWYYRYSHLHEINDSIRPGRVIRQGAQIGVLGKQGASGGWSHLHFEIKSRQPSSKWGTQAGYAFIWEAYRDQYQPQLVANTRRKHFILAGETVTMNGSNSYSATDSIQSYEWSLTDGTRTTGPEADRTYRQPDMFSEVLEITDKAGNVDYDFAEVHVLDPRAPDQYVPRIHAAYWPTRNNKVNEPITFKVRSFGNQEGNEVWDFGDGSPRVSVKSDGNAAPLAENGYAITHHSYQNPGNYLVRVERKRKDGVTAITHLHVHIVAD